MSISELANHNNSVPVIWFEVKCDDVEYDSTQYGRLVVSSIGGSFVGVGESAPAVSSTVLIIIVSVLVVVIIIVSLVVLGRTGRPTTAASATTKQCPHYWHLLHNDGDKGKHVPKKIQYTKDLQYDSKDRTADED
jgi:hypothetical protein